MKTIRLAASGMGEHSRALGHVFWFKVGKGVKVQGFLHQHLGECRLTHVATGFLIAKWTIDGDVLKVKEARKIAQKEVDRLVKINGVGTILTGFGRPPIINPNGAEKEVPPE